MTCPNLAIGLLLVVFHILKDLFSEGKGASFAGAKSIREYDETSWFSNWAMPQSGTKY
jgi:hypothetical protein